MIDICNKTEMKIDAISFETILAHIAPNADMELLIVSDDEIHALNLEYRHIDTPTDVLSFPVKAAKTAFIGSVIISADTTIRVAHELGHSYHDELAILFIHGALHLIGYDHETDNGQMRKREQEIASRIGLATNLLSR